VTGVERRAVQVQRHGAVHVTRVLHSMQSERI
jgi:hypothetical protein